VLRVRLLGATAIEAETRRGPHTVLGASSAPASVQHERPLTLVGFGLRRAWLVADRLVWRMTAEPADASSAPGPAVQTADGTMYRVVDPAVLLRDVEPLAVPTWKPDARPVPAPRPISPAIEKPAAPVTAEVSALPALTREDVEPLGAGPTAIAATPAGAPVPRPPSEPLPAAVPAPARPGAPVAAPRVHVAPGTEPRAGRRALIAEDSITARIFLERLMVQRGFEVTTVTQAHGLSEQWARGGWSLVMIDVDLPDSPGGAHLGAMGTTAADDPPVVALVRDAEDVVRARSAGLRHILAKPFERDELDAMLERVGLSVP
jgi:CheY-like chemotaxis protein